MSITVKYMGLDPIPLKTFLFNGGEVGVKVEPLQEVLRGSRQAILRGQGAISIVVDARLHSSDDIMRLCMVKDALDREFPSYKKMLHMPYVPYARQDRVMVTGESLSIKVFANIINALNFTRVSTLDNHSDVATALIDRCENHSVLEVIKQTNLDYRLNQPDTNYVLVSPDAGAMKKTLKVAQHYGGLKIIKCDKERDTSNGKILSTSFHSPHFGTTLEGMRLLIVDDICDGGMTFIKIAEMLTKRCGPDSIELLVSHGIFSKGLQPLLDSGISHIYTTDSFPQDVKKWGSMNLTVVPL